MWLHMLLYNCNMFFFYYTYSFSDLDVCPITIHHRNAIHANAYDARYIIAYYFGNWTGGMHMYYNCKPFSIKVVTCVIC